MTQTQTASVPTEAGDALYDQIMQRIEPELMTTSVAIDEQYADETVEDYAIRLERYDNAFAEFDRVIGLMEAGQAVKAKLVKDEKQAELTQMEKQEHKEEVSAVEEELENFTDPEQS